MHDFSSIMFNGKSSSEFGLFLPISGRVVGYPAKQKVTTPVPGVNGLVDLTPYVGQTFQERQMTYSFIVADASMWRRADEYTTWQNVLSWLMSPSGKLPLFDNYDPNYYYLAELTQAPTLVSDGTNRFTTLTIIFDCYPFKVALQDEGSDDWDSFDFETDVAQFNKWTINGSRTIDVFNVGENTVLPQLVVTGSITIITSEGELIPLNAGTYDQQAMVSQQVLPVGETIFEVRGQGTLQLIWHREVI
ncbi:hypothetical protein HWN39_10740 [Lactobacillus rhamnosus]|uniref:Phage tail protein n=1 Tax=Lacticaseibacillus rhamnosus TaxID=47715 RepID=A0A7Y7QH04_LACRH|nr:hypothetical protein [Lacticaseibacillus rhamnosus]NVO88955.1 hypothetical protein [Lacticaseibacillus rhamnosus]